MRNMSRGEILLRPHVHAQTGKWTVAATRLRLIDQTKGSDESDRMKTR